MLTATVTKKEVTGEQRNINFITLNLFVTDTTGQGFLKDYSIEFRTGDNIPSKVAQVIASMQSDINSYKARQAIFLSPALNNAVSSIQGGLSV